VVHGHGQQVCDVQFSPHDANLLASSADHSDVKLWRIPAGFSSADASTLQATQVLSHGGRRVDRLRWHPNAANVVATGGVDKIVKLWDVEAGVAQITLSHGGAVDGLAFSHDGVSLASATRDNTVSVWDPRASADTAAATVQAHEGKNKTQRVTFCGKLPLLVTSGFSKFRDREWAVWDARQLGKALKRSVHDAGTTVMNPIYDVDTNLLYMSAKGDSNIRYFEISENKYLQSLNAVSGPEGLRSYCFLPKMACDVMSTEVCVCVCVCVYACVCGRACACVAMH
jgi:WD40 repeat protein